MTSAEECRLDPAVVSDLFVSYRDELRRFLTGVLRNPDAAAEVLQMSFAKTLEQGHTAQPETLKSWLFQVAFRQALDFRRRQETRDKLTRSAAWSGIAKEVGSANPAGLAMQGETAERIQQALRTLPVEQQQVVRMRIYDQMTFAAIAEHLGAPLGTVITRMQLALRKLREQLRSFEGDA